MAEPAFIFTPEVRAKVDANFDLHRLLLRKERCKQSLHYYAKTMWPVLEPGREMKQGWALDGLFEHLEYVTSGDIRKLLINVPPGFMKSLACNVIWPTWEWGPKDLAENRYVHASYAERLSVRDNRKARLVASV